MSFNKDNYLELQVIDNGQGITQMQWEESDSLGHSIIDNICKQLDTKLDISVDNGTYVFHYIWKEMGIIK